MLCAIFLVVVSSENIAHYFSYEWVKYVVANLTFLNFLQHSLPGVFDTHRFTAVNGALWTLKIEVMFYLTVPLFVLLFRKFSHLPILILTYCLSVAYVELFTEAAEITGSEIYLVLGRQLPGQLSYFIAGAALYYFLPIFDRHIKYFLLSAALIFAVNTAFPLTFLEPFALATVVIFFGLFLYVGNFGKYGDFSYGIYILHFPVIQLILHVGWFQESPWYFLLAIVFITTIGAITMWHLVEKQFLLRSSHYVAVTTLSVESSPNSVPDTDSTREAEDGQ